MAAEERAFYLSIYLCKCFYFCPAFYNAYRHNSSSKNVYAKIKGSEVTFMCSDCIEKIIFCF